MNQNILIYGATSAIAQAVARRYAREGVRIALMGRNTERMTEIAIDLEFRGAIEAFARQSDAIDYKNHKGQIEDVFSRLGRVDVALICHGDLPDQESCENNYDEFLNAVNVNFLSTVSLLTQLSPRMSAQGSGTIAVVSSVAGDRGRPSNFVYGSAKAGLSAYVSGLRAKLNDTGVNVITIKPGLVHTPMTAHLEKSAIWSTPEKVAKDITHGIERRKSVVYTPWLWWPVMTIIKSLPEFIFRKMTF